MLWLFTATLDRLNWHCVLITVYDIYVFSIGTIQFTRHIYICRYTCGNVIILYKNIDDRSYIYNVDKYKISI